jgi:hypothetical protein
MHNLTRQTILLLIALMVVFFVFVCVITDFSMIGFAAVFIAITAGLIITANHKTRLLKTYALKGKTAKAVITESNIFKTTKKHTFFRLIVHQELLDPNHSRMFYLIVRAGKHEEDGFAKGKKIAIRIHPADHRKVILLTSLSFTSEPKAVSNPDTIEDRIIKIAERNLALPFTGRKQKATIIGSLTSGGFSVNNNDLWIYNFLISGKKNHNTSVAEEIIKKSAESDYFDRNGLAYTLTTEDHPLKYKIIQDKQKPEICVIWKRKNGKQKKIYTSGIIVFSIIIGIILIPLTITKLYTGYSDSKLSNIAYIPINDTSGFIWEVRYREYTTEDETSTTFDYTKLYVTVYDPVTGKKIIRHTEKVDYEITEDIIISANNDLVYINESAYDINTGEKIDTIDSAYLNSEAGGMRYLNDRDILIRSFSSFSTLDISWYKKSPQAKRQIFGLLQGRGDDRNSLCILSLNENSSIYSERPDLVYESDLKDPQRICSNCSISLASPEQLFLKGHIVYQDSERAIIEHYNKLGAEAKRCLSCIKHKGDSWTVIQDDFPEIDKMENNRDYYSNMKVLVHGKQLIICFFETGFMSVDIETGKVNWVYDLDL